MRAHRICETLIQPQEIFLPYVERGYLRVISSLRLVRPAYHYQADRRFDRKFFKLTGVLLERCRRVYTISSYHRRSHI
ncbi:hypothetical protein CERSUDRAFT_105439 [Gelatoporia subvermispora B]|uniref:Uncharacterized protein n=1 Tax=Ceriporiopsis subvermispora (strain B) TaxID=914234 RepID=M2PM71_CERS8|nr:hypothetical protein CERSUDRAFT_105439 [Gelatoporia subvermispora B]